MRKLDPQIAHCSEVDVGCAVFDCAGYDGAAKGIHLEVRTQPLAAGELGYDLATCAEAGV